MNLIADRFIELSDRRTIDLATAREVMLVTSSAGSRSDQARWVERCDWFARLRHPAIARLIDFGTLGEGSRFEAWSAIASAPAGPAGPGRARKCRAVTKSIEHVSRWLEASGRTVGSLSPGVIAGMSTGVISPVNNCRNERIIAIPGVDSGYEAPATPIPARGAERDDVVAYFTTSRPAVSAIAEIFDLPGPCPRTIALWGAPGAGIRTAIGDLARIARCRGFVPVTVSAERVSHAVVRVLSGRSLCLFLVDGVEATGWQALLNWLMESGKPHILIFAGRCEFSYVEGVELAGIPEDVLAACATPRDADPGLRRRIARAAAAARNSPGRFVQLLARTGAASALRHPGVGRAGVARSIAAASLGHANRAAEEPAVYGSEPSAFEPMPDARPWLVDDALRGRMELAIGQINDGRFAAGVRGLRQSIGCLSRRADWTMVARGSLALARALLGRGRAKDAQVALEGGRQALARGSCGASLWVEAAVLAGVAWTDLGRLDEAESVLHGAVSAARAQCEPVHRAEARLAFARCLFWRERFDEAANVLSPIETPAADLSPMVRIRVAIAASKISVGTGDLAGAVSRATSALEAARQIGDAGLMTRAAYACAFAHRAVGDTPAMQADVALCLATARTARDPLRALRARLLAIEQSLPEGRSRRTRALLHRMARLPVSHLPVTVRVRCEVLNMLLNATDTRPAADVVARRVAATGLRALRLFVPASDLAAAVQTPARSTIGEALDILQCCQAAVDGRTITTAVLVRIKQQVHAVAAACVSTAGQVIAAEGSRVDTAFAARVVDAGQTIAPHFWDGCLQGGAPVRYGGEPIAALVCRWAPGTAHDASQAAPILTFAAAAIGPAVAEMLLAGRPGPGRGTGDILGSTPAIEKVRQSIEQVAEAPFAVLIEGESGSGKELVARGVHRCGLRRDRPFRSLNCAALPDDLVETELFGHARGAFTGAVIERPGLFEEAHTGTLFLDEIGELSARAQAKVLRTIQEGEIRRVGENIARRVDVRLIAATNRNLRDEVAAGRFRQDLLYRIDVVRITVPALRDRREDIALLADRFWQDAAGRVGSKAVLGAATTAALVGHDWPGNVRELQNVLASLAVRSPKRGVVPPSALPPHFHVRAVAESFRLDEARQVFDERFIKAALARNAGHRQNAAQELGVTRQGLAKLMARLQIAD